VPGLKSSSDRIEKGIGIRSDGGYTIVPPSAINGTAYEWELSGPKKPRRLCPRG